MNDDDGGDDDDDDDDGKRAFASTLYCEKQIKK